MRASIIGVLLLTAGALGLGCGGTESPADVTPLQEAQQELQACGGPLPPCPTGYYCTADIRGVCYPENPAPCGKALPACPTGFYCSGYPRGACLPSP